MMRVVNRKRRRNYKGGWMKRCEPSDQEGFLVLSSKDGCFRGKAEENSVDEIIE